MMGIPVLILGESGSGKSHSLINMNGERVLLIKSIRKFLPFRKPSEKGFVDYNKESNPEGNVFTTDNYEMIKRCILGGAKSGKYDSIIIDDAQYLMANDFMRRVSERGFDKFTEMACSFHGLFMAAQECENDVRVYFMCHTDTDQTGKTKMKTIGKMLDEKITMEGLFTVVLNAERVDGEHRFRTKGTNMDTVKSPVDMFESEMIPNDLALVDKAICDYWL